MANKEELEAMGILKNEKEQNSKTDEMFNALSDGNSNKEYSSLYISCFLFPLLGFITCAIHIVNNNKLARNCLAISWASTVIIAIIIALCFLFGY